MCDILNRRQTHFVLWCPRNPANDPELILGQIVNGNPPTFSPVARQSLRRAADAAGAVIDGLLELDPNTLGLTDGQTYHYWFEVDNTFPGGGGGRIQVCDPLAAAVDYRLLAPANPSLAHPAAVTGWSGGRLVTRDPNGEQGRPAVA